MSAHAYIAYADVPEQLRAAAVPHRDGITDAQLVALDECPISGEITRVAAGIQIEYSWPRDLRLRHALVDWFTRHGIHFTVVM